MAKKEFSQKNFNLSAKCDGCEAQCSLTYKRDIRGLYPIFTPVIGGKAIEKYKSEELGPDMPVSTDCNTPMDAILLAKKIVKLCDHYKHR